MMQNDLGLELELGSNDPLMFSNANIVAPLHSVRN